VLQYPLRQTRLQVRPTLEFDTESQGVTFIEVYACQPGVQPSVIGALERMNRSSASRQGFIAAALLRSITGCRVVNYQQWTAERKCYLARKTPSYQHQRSDLEELGVTKVSRFYDVVYSRHRVTGQRTSLEQSPHVIVINDILGEVQQKYLTTLLLDSYGFSLGPYHCSTDIHISWTGNSSLNFVQLDDMKTALYTLEQTLPELFQDIRLPRLEVLSQVGIHLYDISQLIHKD
jgi:hypothetical protein